MRSGIEQLVWFQPSFQFPNFKGLFGYLLLGIPQFLFKDGIRYMKSVIGQQLKILQSIIILNPVYVMHNFPWQKASIQTFSHYKAMLWHITSITNHRIKEIIGLQPQLYISSDKKPTTFPHRVLFPTNTITVATLKTNGLLVNHKNPAWVSTNYAGVPNYRSCTMSFITYCSTIFNYLAHFWHTSIITYLKELFNEPFICKSAN